MYSIRTLYIPFLVEILKLPVSSLRPPVTTLLSFKSKIVIVAYSSGSLFSELVTLPETINSLFSL